MNHTLVFSTEFEAKLASVSNGTKAVWNGIGITSYNDLMHLSAQKLNEDRELYAVCSLLYLLIPSTSLNRLYHFKDKLCADLKAFAELIAVGEIMQLNVRRLIFVKNFSAVGIGFFQFGFCLDESVEGCLI